MPDPACAAAAGARRRSCACSRTTWRSPRAPRTSSSTPRTPRRRATTTACAGSSRALTALRGRRDAGRAVRQADRGAAHRSARAGGAAGQRQPRRALGDAGDLLRARAARPHRLGRPDRGLLAVHRLPGRAAGDLRDLRPGGARALRRDAARAAGRQRRARRHGRRAAGGDHPHARGRQRDRRGRRREGARAAATRGPSTSSARTSTRRSTPRWRPRRRRAARGRGRRSTPPSCWRDCSRATSSRTSSPTSPLRTICAPATCPAGVSLAEAAALRRGDPASSRRWRWPRWCATSGRCWRCASAARWCSTTATTSVPTPPAAGCRGALTIDIFTARYLRPLFCRGIGPFRWICLSGEDADLRRVDELCLELFAARAADRRLDRRSRAARRPAGPARPDRLARPRRARRLALAVNDAVADGRLRRRWRSPATTWTRAR